MTGLQSPPRRHCQSFVDSAVCMCPVVVFESCSESQHPSPCLTVGGLLSAAAIVVSRVLCAVQLWCGVRPSKTGFSTITPNVGYNKTFTERFPAIVTPVNTAAYIVSRG